MTEIEKEEYGRMIDGQVMAMKYFLKMTNSMLLYGKYSFTDPIQEQHMLRHTHSIINNTQHSLQRLYRLRDLITDKVEEADD